VTVPHLWLWPRETRFDSGRSLMKKLLWICPRCGGKNRLRLWKCRRCRARVALQRRLDLALLWAGALR